MRGPRRPRGGLTPAPRPASGPSRRAACRGTAGSRAARCQGPQPGTWFKYFYGPQIIFWLNLKLINLQHCRHRRVNRVLILLFVYAKQRGNKRFKLYTWLSIYCAHLANTLMLVCWYLAWHRSSSTISSISLLRFSSSFFVCSSKWSRQLFRSSAARFW